ncbi:MAG TPA: glutathione S-transferase family protein [Caldimonas sp.]|jgi:glutathione S-transferase|nr:glutathione S-transferase family protein [Caldimonas sp.]HEX2541223.1 glutathione S-transferase family protein [Caldimonas sp.]
MLKLHGFAQSGNTFKVAFLLRALGLPWQAVPISFADFAAGATRDPAWREGVNAMGEVPVLEEESGRKLTQSGAILAMLAERHGRFGGRSDDERWEVLRWLFFDNHKFTSYFATWRFMKSFAATAPDAGVAAFLKSRIDGAFGIVDRHLAGRPYLVGDGLTVADMSLSGYLFYPSDESGYVLEDRFPNLAAWRERLREAPGWGDPYDVLPGERIAPRW